ncbi:MAG: hypothetical protein HY519_03300, partial [Candidatus Aenigmarchaeota archaeon]|nr:hypothetical protein [Candidatus Aenigmarchaeota archaeon]
MRWLCILFLAVLASGCTAAPGSNQTQGISQDKSQQGAGQATCAGYTFASAEREISVLAGPGNAIGNEHYQRLAQALDCLAKTVDAAKISSVRQQLDRLNPDVKSVSFSAVQREIEALYNAGNTIGPEHYAKLDSQLASLGQAGYDISALRQQLETVRPLAEKTATADNPAALKDLAAINKLPECNGQMLSDPPADLGDVQEISPLGNIGVPGHTLPTPHLYFHISAGRATTNTVPLLAPGNVTITSVTSSFDELGKIDEYSIGFALCKDVYGYFNHVKGLSAGLQQALDTVPCADFTDNPGNRCAKDLFYPVNAGTEIGRVGHLQGNF